MSDKLTDAEMRLFMLGAAMYGTNTEGTRIIANALGEMTANRKKVAAKKPKRRPKK